MKVNYDLFKSGYTIKLNFESRKQTVGSTQYLVFPVVAMIEGVHNELLYTAEELNKNVSMWNGVPITINHPQDRRGGNAGVNDTPELMEIQVGKMFYVSAEGGKLKGELWIDVARIKEISPESLGAIQSGRLEVSVGLFSGGDGTKGIWNGEEFQETLFGYIPDHIALLPEGVGACSWADGCGVRENMRKKASNFNLDEGGKKMLISKERIDALYTNEHFLLPDDESTRTLLANMKEEDFVKLEECQCSDVETLKANNSKLEDEKKELIKTNSELDTKVKEQEKTITDKKEEKKEEPKINKEEIKKEVINSLTFDDVLKLAPEDWREQVEDGIRTNKAKKEQLIKALDGSPFTNEELEEKKITELEKLVTLGDLKNVDYSGKGGANKVLANKYEKTSDGKGVPKMPTIAEYQASLKK